MTSRSVRYKQEPVSILKPRFFFKPGKERGFEMGQSDKELRYSEQMENGVLHFVFLGNTLGKKLAVNVGISQQRPRDQQGPVMRIGTSR